MDIEPSHHGIVSKGDNDDFMSEFLHFVQEGIHVYTGENILYDPQPVSMPTEPISLATSCPSIDIADSGVDSYGPGAGVLQDIDLYLECSDDEVCQVAESVDITSQQTALIGNNVRLRVSFPVPNITAQKTFQCLNCVEDFCSQRQLREHMKKSHGGMISCSLCSYKTKSEKVFHKHRQKKHHSSTSCGHKVASSEEHGICASCSSMKCMCVIHSEKEVEATVSTEMEDSKTMEDLSLGPTSTTGAMNSEEDNEQDTSHSTSLPSETYKHCNEEKRDLTDCSACTDPETHGSVVTLIACDSCSYTTPSAKLLKLHCKTMHDSTRQLHSCHMCPATFRQKRSLEGHINAHLNTNNFKCDICSKTFNSASSLHRHSKTHTTTRHYKCDIEGCDQSFKMRGTLTDHKKKVHCKKSPCSVVDCISFDEIPETEPISVTVPAKISSGRCEASTSTAALAFTQLSSTTSTAPDSEPLSLTRGLCGGTRKPVSCPWIDCGKSFRDNYNFQKHYRVHTGVKDITCPWCSYSCVQKASLDYHLKKQHGNK